MLRAEKTGLMGKKYEITEEDGRIAAVFERGWKGGRVTVDDDEFTLKFKGWGKVHTLVAADGTVVAEADGVGRRRWSMRADGVEYRFERTAMMSKNIAMVSGDQQVGTITRGPGMRRGADVDVPGLGRVLQVFVLSAVLDAWDRQGAAAGSAAAGASGG